MSQQHIGCKIDRWLNGMDEKRDGCHAMHCEPNEDGLDWNL
jgi:hypothetical protein